MSSICVLSVICVIAHFATSVRAIGPLGAFGVGVGTPKCDPSITTASGTYAIHKGKHHVRQAIQSDHKTFRFHALFLFVCLFAFRPQQAVNIALVI